MKILNKFCSNIFIRYKIGIEQNIFFIGIILKWPLHLDNNG